MKASFPNISLLCILACILLISQIKAEITNKVMIASNTLYTTDFINNIIPYFGHNIMKMSAMTEIDSSRPIWDITVQLNNTKGEEMSGFIGFEYQKYEPSIQFGDRLKPKIHINRLCKFNSDMINRKFIQDSHIHASDVHFESFSFTTTNDFEIRNIKTMHHVKETGVWINVIHLCIDPKFTANSDDIKMSAHQITMNPLGYLGGEYLISLPILALLGLIYIVLSLLWLYWTLKYHQYLIPFIHWFIYFGINIGLIETIFHFYHYKQYNINGKPSSMIMISDTIASLILSLYARWVMVLISTGHGIVFPNLNKKVIWFMLSYSVAYIFVYLMLKKNEINLVIHELSSTQHTYQGWIICLAFLDVIITWYIIENLTDILDTLTNYKQRFKLDLYKTLAYVLVIMTIGSSIGICLHLCFEKFQLYTNPSYWTIFWFLRDGIWRIICLFIGLTVIYIWKPHKYSLKYLYSEEIDGNDDEYNEGMDMNPMTPQMRNEVIESDFQVTLGWTQQIYDAEMDFGSKNATPSFQHILAKLKNSKRNSDKTDQTNIIKEEGGDNSNATLR